MAEPTFDRKKHVLTQQNAVDALGKAIGEIKQQDGMTWADIGAVLGVSEDSAAKYATGMASMTFTTFMRGKREWGGRFTGPVDRLVLNSRPGTVSGHMAVTHLLSAISAIHMADRDGTLSARDIHEHRSTLEVARDQLDGVLSQLKLREAV